MQESKYLQDISEIRSLMERSSRFMSLSGYSGIVVGLLALAGAAAAHLFIHQFDIGLLNRGELLQRLVGVAFVVLTLALFVASWLTIKRARKQGVSIWDATVRRLMINMGIPLVSGGVFVLLLLLRGYVGIIAPAMLLFYGLSLINASKYTLTDIRYLGMVEVGLGLLATAFPGWGLWFWAIGFGILHIIYGTSMYFKYER